MQELEQNTAESNTEHQKASGCEMEHFKSKVNFYFSDKKMKLC